MSLPKWYKEWIDRVSNIVSFVFPFKWTPAEQRYLDWLADNVSPKLKRGYAIPVEEYMEEACSVGTFVHLQLEKHSLWKRVQRSHKLFKKHQTEIESWMAHIDKLNKDFPLENSWFPETVVCDNKNRYQWTIDLVRIDEDNKTVYLYDWKTYWIAKKKWKLPNKYKSQTEKYKKLALQLSLYAETFRQKWYKIGWIYWLFLHETWCYETELKLYSTEDIDKILLDYRASKIIKNNPNINMSFNLPFKVEILEPTKAYGNVKLTLDLANIDNWKTDKENIDELIKKSKYIASKLI